MTRPWRIVVHGACDPYWNMAVDTVILEEVIRGESPPTLRLYEWGRPAVTIGRFQVAERGIELEFCRRHGIPIVRRPTGGRGVLHGGDLTVSLIVPEMYLGPAVLSVAESYRELSAGFIRAFNSLGFSPKLTACERPAGEVGDCFAARTAADIIDANTGEKLVGSALRRKDGALLQQTSIRHRRPAVDPSCIFRGVVSSAGFPLESISVGELRAAIADGFDESLGVDLSGGMLSDREMRDSERIAQSIEDGGLNSSSVDSGRGI